MISGVAAHKLAAMSATLSSGSPPSGPICRGPAVSMHFSPVGKVLACCQNGDYSFGEVATSSLQDIWQGMRRQRMVESFAAGRYPAGCELCEVEHVLGNRSSTPAAAFDRFEDESPAWPRQLEFTLSNRCNLACIQCNGDQSSTIRSKRESRLPIPLTYTDSFFEQLPPFLQHAEIVNFLGGEPFLAPEARRVWDLLLDTSRKSVVNITTNATVWNDAVHDYVYGLKMDFVVSIDGATKETFEAVREGAHYDRVIGIRDRLLAATRSYGGNFQLNYCLLRANWHELGPFVLQADELDVDVNIIPVFDPKAHSLFTLPADELAPIVERLGKVDSRLRARLGRNRGRWDDVVRVLRDQLIRVGSDGARDARMVHIRTERASDGRHLEAENRLRSERLVGDAERDLRAWAGRDGIEVTIDAGVVQAVRAPAWATPLHTDEWVGLDIESIGAVGAARMGKVELSPPQDLSGGDGLVVLSESVVRSGDGTYRFRTVYSPFLGRMLVNTPDPLRPY